MTDAVLTDVSDGIAVITINRPEARNAINGDVARGIAAAVEDFDSRPDVTVLVLTGAGATFSAGMDLKGFLSGDAPTAGDRGFGGITQRPPAKPVIAALRGDALAGRVGPPPAFAPVQTDEGPKCALPHGVRGP